MLVFLLTACDQEEPENTGPVYVERSGAQAVYRMAVHPLHNPRKLIEAYTPLVSLLNEKIPDATFQVEASRDYQAYEVKFRARKPEILLPNPWQTREAIKVGYRVIAMAGDPEDFKGIFVVRKDSGIKAPSDLIGKTVTYPSPTALAASIMPQRFLHDNGINVVSEIDNQYVGSQESSILNVFMKKSAAGATWPPPWRLFQIDRPKEAAQLEVAWETPPLINNSLMVRDDFPETMARQIQSILFELHETDRGKGILKGIETAHFHPATNDTYDVIRDFIESFEADIRPVEEK
jgi:phosphonate transport system substrate-binding protein